MKSTEFVEKAFSDFYRAEAKFIAPPLEIEKREFGFLLFPESRMFRHKGFCSADELRSFFEGASISDAYYSCAYYEDSEAEMDKKGWLGADLVFDIDADHILTPCNKVHDEWSCASCGFAGKGEVPENCPSCGGQKFSAKTWPCELCLKSAKAEVIKLLDMLTADFGFSERDVHVFFSGHRGYHIHVENEVVKGLDSNERKEIVDYVSGLGFDGTLHSLVEKDWDFSRALKTLGFNDLGWRGRIAKGLYGFILKAKDEDFDKLGLPKNVVATVIKNRDSILHDWGDKSSRKLAKGVGLETWKKLIEFCARSQAAQIDTVVTTDTHRLIRMPKTLHGKTGLKKAEVPLSEIESYDPFNDAVAFKKGIATVFISSVPEFMLGGQTFGPYENKQVELPTAAAVLLVCKGRAKVVE